MCTAGQIAHHQRAHKSSEIPDRVNQPNRSSGRRLTEKEGRYCPETRLEPVESSASHDKQKNRYGRIGAIDHREYQSDATEEDGQRRMPSPLARPVGMPPVQLLRDE